MTSHLTNEFAKFISNYNFTCQHFDPTALLPVKVYTCLRWVNVLSALIWQWFKPDPAQISRHKGYLAHRKKKLVNPLEQYTSELIPIFVSLRLRISSTQISINSSLYCSRGLTYTSSVWIVDSLLRYNDSTQLLPKCNGSDTIHRSSTFYQCWRNTHKQRFSHIQGVLLDSTFLKRLYLRNYWR